MSKKFRLGENCDSPINEQLATNVTDIFRNGISQERYRDLFKDEKLTRPQNCEGLVTVQTDQMVWDILYAGESQFSPNLNFLLMFAKRVVSSVASDFYFFLGGSTLTLSVVLVLS
jgi:hypothetical protein